MSQQVLTELRQLLYRKRKRTKGSYQLLRALVNAGPGNQIDVWDHIKPTCIDETMLLDSEYRDQCTAGVVGGLIALLRYRGFWQVRIDRIGNKVALYIIDN